MNLLIDMGNSRIKWAYEQQGKLTRQEALSNAHLNEDALIQCWQTLPAPQQVAIASVSSPQGLASVLTVAKMLWPASQLSFAQAQAQGFGVKSGYLQPEKLGVDRWLALIAARQGKQATCVVDCGTAITVDLLDGEGQHLGGLICPGLTLMKQALAAGTQALGFYQQDFALQPAQFTEAAIDSGTAFAAIGLIEAILARQSGNFHLLLTGGDAERIAEGLQIDYQIDADLVLRGLALTLKGQE
ncbi:pantothenate kinase [Methylosoma difficile]